MKHAAFLALSLLVAAACSGGGSDLLSSGGSSGSSGSSSGASGSSSGASGSSSGASGSSSGASGSSSGSSGSSSGATDAGKDGTVVADGGVNAFTGAAAYTACTPFKNSVSNKHNGPIGNSNPAGRNCVDCHKVGGSAGAYLIAFGGTVYTNAAGTTAAGAGIEVRLRDSAGRSVSACTDAAGNFHEQPAINPVFPLQAGARTAATTVLMSTNATGGGCNANGCHSGVGTATRIHLP
jgi:hypothetical protein